MNLSMPEPVHSTSYRVLYGDTDAAGVVYYANYLRYMQEAALDASAAVGYDKARYDAMEHFWLIMQTGIIYFRPLQFGDTVIVKTWVSDFRRATSRRRRHYACRNSACIRDSRENARPPYRGQRLLPDC